MRSRTPDDFREIFLNPPDIGGRYSALTYVGLVPASLIGVDLDPLLAAGAAMLGACHEPDPALNPGLSLGLAMATLAKAGRDKLTFLIDDEIASFGAWAEQLIAESTGKRGVGIVPVDLEPLGTVESYGADRTFVRIVLAGSDPGRRRRRLRRRRATGRCAAARRARARQRDEDGWQPDDRQLGDRARTGTTDADVCRGVGVLHVVDVLDELDEVTTGVGGELLGDLGVGAGAGLQQEADVVAIAPPLGQAEGEAG